jgi:hypothetical protein
MEWGNTVLGVTSQREVTVGRLARLCLVPRTVRGLPPDHLGSPRGRGGRSRAQGSEGGEEAGVLDEPYQQPDGEVLGTAAKLAISEYEGPARGCTEPHEGGAVRPSRRG